MAGGYDGSIRIDTRIETKGFNAGMKKVTTAAQGVMQKIVAGLKVGAVVALSVIAAIVGIAAALAGAGIAAYKFFEKLTYSLAKSLSPMSAYYGEVMNLKAAFDSVKGSLQAAFTTLLTAATPALMAITGWLVKVLNLISMIVATLLGQKTIMQYVSGSAEGLADGTGRAAKNTKKLGEAAKGALAAFDQLNVLQMNEQDNSSGGGAGSGGNIMFKEVAIDNSILETINNIKQWFVDTWDSIKQGAVDAWDTIKQTGINTWENLKKAAIDSWNGVKQSAIDTWENLKLTWANLKQTGIDTWNSIKQTAIDTWNNVKQSAINAWEGLKQTWANAKLWFKTSVSDPIENAWTNVTGSIKTTWETTWDGIKLFTKNTINTIIDFINSMITAMVKGVNSAINALNGLKVTIPAWVPAIGGKSWGLNIPTVTAPQIPRLATGAVIPPNAQFAAILGDQKNGRNIETPENLLRQIMREEGQNGSFTVTMPVYLDNEKIYEGQKKIAFRKGQSLITSGATE